MLNTLNLCDARLLAASLIRELNKYNPNKDLTLFAYGSSTSMLVAIAEKECLLEIKGNSFKSSFFGKAQTGFIGFEPWQTVDDFLALTKGLYVTGYIGFDVHSNSNDKLAQASYPSVWLTVPKVVFEVRQTGCKCILGNSQDYESILEKVNADSEISSYFDSIPISLVNFDTRPGEVFIRKVEKVLERIQQDALGRATIARKISLPSKIDLVKCLVSKGDRSSINDSRVSRSVYLKSPHIEFVCQSPEPLAIGTVSSVETYKLSGTYPRGTNSDSDFLLLKQFLQDEKIQREHKSSVTSLQSSLLNLGDVQFKDPEVLDLSNIRHLMTILRTKPNPSSSIADVLRAVFPSGVSPYKEGLSTLAELEDEGRGAYYGLVGYIDASGFFSFSQMLRGIFKQGEETFSWVGAAITNESVPLVEYEETRLKLGNIRANL